MFIEDLSWLWPDEGSEQAEMSRFEVCFDGSGTIGHNHAIAYGGVFGTVASWGFFNEQWAHLLKKHGLTFFKMDDAYGFHNEWKPKKDEWGEDCVARRNAVLREFADAALRAMSWSRGKHLQVAGSCFGESHFQDAGKVAEKKKRLFQMAVTNVVELLRTVPPDIPLLIVCDREQDVEHDYRSWIDGALHRHPEVKLRITGLCFMDDKRHPPLQLADMVAYLICKEGERFVEGLPESKQNPLYNLLIPPGMVTFDQPSDSVKGSL